MGRTTNIFFTLYSFTYLVKVSWILVPPFINFLYTPPKHNLDSVTVFYTACTATEMIQSTLALQPIEQVKYLQT